MAYIGELDNGNGGACTGTGLSAAFRKKVYYIIPLKKRILMS